MNVLVFPGGTEIGLEIFKSLSEVRGVRLFSADVVPNHAQYLYRRNFIISSERSNNWLREINNIVRSEHIEYIIPANDDAAVNLSSNIHSITAKIVSSPSETCVISRSKSLTYQHLKDVIPVPLQFSSVADVNEYPIFVKPDKGQGSQFAEKIHGFSQLEKALSHRRDLILLEYLPGDEYTVDCFSDREDGLLFCRGRKRVRIKNGLSIHCESAQKDVFQKYAQAICTRLKLYGAWFYQIKEDKAGGFKLLEVAPRIAGTMALHRVMGVNFPLLSIYELERKKLDPIFYNNIKVEIDRALINRYSHDLHYSYVYVDLDDTLIFDDRVNLSVVRFVYQCINEGKKIILITKHAGNLEHLLQNYRLTGLFDKIIHLTRNEEKADHIIEKEAIFIDDSYQERLSVHQKTGLLTFNSSMIEMLFDERR